MGKPKSERRTNRVHTQTAKAREAGLSNEPSDYGPDMDFNKSPPPSPGGEDPLNNTDGDEESEKNDDNVTATKVAAKYGGSDSEEEARSEDDDEEATTTPPHKRRKNAKTDSREATAVLKELRQLGKYANEADRTTILTNTTRNIAGIVMDKKFVVPVHSATRHMAEPGEESDDEHHNETVGHSGVSGVAVHIPQGALGKKATLKGVDRLTIEQFYGDPNNHKKLYAVEEASTNEKQTYNDVLLFPFIPTIFLDWLVATKRTPYQLYSHILLFIRNIEDTDLREKCHDICKPLLSWCLCSCQKEKKSSAGPLTQLKTPIMAILSPTRSCSTSLATRLTSTMGSAPHSQKVDKDGGKGDPDMMAMAATAAASAAASTAQMLSFLKQQQQQGNTAAAAKDDSGWSDHLWEQACGFCGVTSRRDVPAALEQVLEAKEVTEATGMIVKAMHEEAATMGVHLTPFHISSSRVKEFRKGIFATGQRATLADLKSGIVILDLVERTGDEIASLQTQEREERQSERNRSLDESKSIAQRQKQNIGAVPDNVPDAKQTLTNYVVFIRVLFGKRCPHYLSVFRAKEMVDGWNKESATAEMIKNLFWAIIVDARQFFKAWHTTPSSKLDYTIESYEAGHYNRIVTLPLTWREGEEGTGGGSRPAVERGSEKDGGARRQAGASNTALNRDMHPLAANLMKPYNAVFSRHTLGVLCKEAGCTRNELPTLRVESDDREGCMNYFLGYCKTAETGTCTRRHLLKRETKTDDATKVCTLIRPGIKRMIENKHKYKHLGIKE